MNLTRQLAGGMQPSGAEGYTAELAEPGPREALGRLRALAADAPVTLLTATRELSLSQAAVLADLLRETG